MMAQMNRKGAVAHCVDVSHVCFPKFHGETVREAQPKRGNSRLHIAFVQLHVHQHLPVLALHKEFRDV
jgi:hypothetical protein